MNKNKSRRFDKGLTLIEVIVSVALLAIVSLMLITITETAVVAVKATRTKTNNAMSAAAQVETKHAASSTGGTSSSLTINFGGNNYDVSGSYVSGQDGDVTYKEFVPD
ncbi:MAG TPA: prepilin-type N-terminal cleavage/methylation domain-containing protein [Ruminiclostridium sp.]|nr:prepilin-type N-terminal cleavage/methylation domain-containing protein [Ruminiclostridium sp.]